MVTFVQATFLLGTFVHISNISDLTDPILTKLLGPNFLGASIFVGQNFCPTTHLPTTIHLTSSDKLQHQLQIQLQLQLLAYLELGTAQPQLVSFPSSIFTFLIELLLKSKKLLLESCL